MVSVQRLELDDIHGFEVHLRLDVALTNTEILHLRSRVGWVWPFEAFVEHGYVEIFVGRLTRRRVGERALAGLRDDHQPTEERGGAEDHRAAGQEEGGEPERERAACAGERNDAEDRGE